MSHSRRAMTSTKREASSSSGREQSRASRPRTVDAEHVQAELEALRTVAREADAYLDLEELDDPAIAASEGSPLWALKVALTGLIQTFPSSLEES